MGVYGVYLAHRSPEESRKEIESPLNYDIIFSQIPSIKAAVKEFMELKQASMSRYVDAEILQMLSASKL